MNQRLDQIRPICLPLHEPLRSSNLIGYSPFVAGWGSMVFLGPQSTILRDAQVPIISTAECEKNYKSKYSMQVFDNRIICAGSGGHDACQGDSGFKFNFKNSLSSLSRRFMKSNFLNNVLYFSTIAHSVFVIGGPLMVAVSNIFIYSCDGNEQNG